MPKRIAITGATGLIGKKLCDALLARGDEVTVFTRNVLKGKQQIHDVKNFVEWNYRRPNEWKNEFEGLDAVIHLAGANIGMRRWTEEYKKLILESRQLSTKNLVRAFHGLNNKPKVFISAGGINYYGNQGDELLTEESSGGTDFMAEVCKAWEYEASLSAHLGIRWVSLRQSPALDPEAGVLKEFLLPFKLFVGGPLGNGNQWFSWTHIEDLVNIYLFVLDNRNLNGIVNASSPNPVRMRVFTGTLGKVLNRPSYFKVPVFVLRIIKGEVADHITSSMKVIPKRLLESGFDFKFKDLEGALRDLLQKK